MNDPKPKGDVPAIIVREATKADDAQICAQMRRVAMPGRISVTYSHEPSFFQSIEVEGTDHRIAVAERESEVLGAGLMAKRRVYLNGEPAEVGYISNLRGDPSIRNRLALGRGVRLFKKWHDDGFGVPYYLCAILKDNLAARRLLTSGRAGLPISHDIGEFYDAAIPLFRRPRPRLRDGLRVVRGDAVGADAVIEFLNNVGKSRQFYPVYTVDDLQSEGGRLRGLQLDDFYVCLSGNLIVGVTAAWNQFAFRRIIVFGSSRFMRVIRPALSPFMRMIGLPPLGKAGEPLKNIFAACIAVKNDDPIIFKTLLDDILYTQSGKGKLFILVGMMSEDPLLPVVRQFRHIPTLSCVYAVEWDGAEVLARLDNRIPYLELASL